MNKKNDNDYFTSLEKIQLPNWSRVCVRILAFILIFTIIVLTFVPWQQTSQGNGSIIAFDPNDRVQKLSSTVPGRIEKWFVRDGSKIKKGDPIVEVVDNDPNFIERLGLERDAVFTKYDASKAAAETALLNFKRQKSLLDQGLTSRTKYEKAKITYKKFIAEEASSAASLAKAEVKLSRQQTQMIRAPRDGTILRILHGSGNVYVQEGETIATFVPDTLQMAAEVYVSGNDLPLVYPGRQVRLQFEGWPAVQFSGWPSVAVGTFGGIVSIVDPSASQNGKFRVVITPEKGANWPNNTYLRQGTRVYGWILLNNVKLGYELWRQFNGFPPALEQEPQDSDINGEKSSKKKKKKKKKKDE